MSALSEVADVGESWQVYVSVCVECTLCYPYSPDRFIGWPSEDVLYVLRYLDKEWPYGDVPHHTPCITLYCVSEQHARLVCTSLYR